MNGRKKGIKKPLKKDDNNKEKIKELKKLLNEWKKIGEIKWWK